MPSGPLLIIRPPTAGSYGVIEPTGLGMSGSGDFQARNLVWTSWNETGASGHGTEVVYNCVNGCSHTEPVTITLSDVVGGRYTNMLWTIGSTDTSHLSGSDLFLQLSVGGKQVAVPGLAPPSPSSAPTLAPSSTPTTPSGSRNYNNLSQLDQAITDWIVQTKGASLQSEATCAETSTDNYKCTVFYRPSGAEHVAIVSVTPNGSSFTVVSYN